jgi:hypothetical protein
MHETIFTDRTARAIITERVVPRVPQQVGGHPPDTTA